MDTFMWSATMTVRLFFSWLSALKLLWLAYRGYTPALNFIEWLTRRQ